MARKPEATYTSDIKKKLGAGVYALKLCLPYTAGVADSWYDGPARDLWVEYKFMNPLPKTIDLVGGKDPVLTKLQQDFLKARYENGRNVAVIVGSKSGGVMFPGLSWQTPITRDEFLARAQTKPEVANDLTKFVSDLTESVSAFANTARGS